MMNHYKYLQECYQVATHSPDPRTWVGAVLVDSLGNKLGAACNRSALDNWEKLCINKKACFTHAERNIIYSIAKKYGGQPLRGATIYITGLPCWDCANAIMEFGLGTVVYHQPIMRLAVGKEEYFLESENMLIAKGIQLVSIDEPIQAPLIKYDGGWFDPNV